MDNCCIIENAKKRQAQQPKAAQPVKERKLVVKEVKTKPVKGWLSRMINFGILGKPE